MCAGGNQLVEAKTDDQKVHAPTQSWSLSFQVIEGKVSMNLLYLIEKSGKTNKIPRIEWWKKSKSA